jgi:hypothetical protein
LVSGAKTLVQAAQMLESDSDAMLNGNFTFQTDKLVFSANDRLLAPKTPTIDEAIKNILQTFGEQLHGTKSVSITSQITEGQPSFAITSQNDVPLENLLKNLLS